tara:strand:+ start:309 stop:503 length:195 start_codon:yes stop_codon:yes gene_type:complete
MIKTNIMNKEEVADYLKLSIPSIDRYMKNEGLPYSKIGKSVRYIREDIESWVRSKNVNGRYESH